MLTIILFSRGKILFDPNIIIIISIKRFKLMNICIYGSSSNHIDKAFLDESEALGIDIASKGHTLVYGAGGEGIMGAVARGAASCNGNIIGIVPEFLDFGGNLFTGCSKLIKTKDMHERKQLLEDKSDAFIILPGGVGTFDEFFETLTLKQLGQHNKAIVIYNINGYFDEIETTLEKAITQHFMTESCHEIYKFFDDRSELFKYLAHYHSQNINIHEMKYVDNHN